MSRPIIERNTAKCSSMPENNGKYRRDRYCAFVVSQIRTPVFRTDTRTPFSVAGQLLGSLLRQPGFLQRPSVKSGIATVMLSPSRELERPSPAAAPGGIQRKARPASHAFLYRAARLETQWYRAWRRVNTGETPMPLSGTDRKYRLYFGLGASFTLFQVMP